MLYLKEFVKSKQELNLKENTIATYESLLNRFNSWLCEYNNVSYLQKSTILNISTATIQKYVNELKSEYSKNTVVLHVASIKEYFNFLKHNSIIKENPCYGVRIPKDKIRQEKKKPMTIVDVNDMISKIDNSRDMAMVTLGFVLGMRREEISSIELKNIDIQDGTIVFLRKGGKIQTLPIIESARPAIEAQYNLALSKGHSFLFQSTHGRKAITPTQVFNVIKKYTEFAPHDLRRVACKNLNDKSVNINIIQKFMGHESQVTTQRYINYSSNEVLNALRGI
jgi:site-specific recombinase XerD